MKDFIEKWNSDSKFKTKVKLGLYTLFVVIVSIFALSSRNTNTVTNTIDFNDETINQEETINTITIPDEYTYTTKITINEKNYQYSGTKDTNKETIIKIVDNENANYIYQESDYYKLQDEQYVLTTKDEVYDIIDYNYLQIETINKYLSKSNKENEMHKVYLKDIVLDNDSDEYITITISENKINIDYTSLIKLFDNNIEKCLIEIVIEEKE